VPTIADGEQRAEDAERRARDRHDAITIAGCREAALSHDRGVRRLLSTCWMAT
jgi:hypothetical protein